MPEEIKRKRGRPPKNKTTQELNTIQISDGVDSIDERSYEFNSYSFSSQLIDSIFSCGLYDYFTKEQIKNILRDPIGNHEEAIMLSDFVYTKNGMVSNSIDYMQALLCLDRIIACTSKRNKQKSKNNKELMRATLKTIDDKSFVRDALHTEMRQGIAFYYFDVRKKNNDLTKYMTDYEVENIVEINEVGVNARMVTLPWKYTKIVGKKNGRYVLAFNLRYFDDYTGEKLERKLRKYPSEIVDGYNKRRQKNNVVGDWLILDNDKTLCRKIKCKDSEAWGRSLVIAVLEDVLYKDYFTDTKRNVLDEINNSIIYQTFPEGRDKGTSSLSKSQQQEQHNTVKSAVVNKNNRGGISFFSVASGTKLNKIEVNCDIFDSKNESNLNENISQGLGICGSLIGAMATGNFSSSQSNLEMITAKLYTWAYEWQNELNHVINKNIIKDDNNKVEVYYFPTSFVNKQNFFDMMKSLYMEASGSLTYLIASTGLDPELYLNVLDEEYESGLFDKYEPHKTAYTKSDKQNSESGRPTVKNPTNENTIRSKSNNSNETPRPSTK